MFVYGMGCSLKDGVFVYGMECKDTGWGVSIRAGVLVNGIRGWGVCIWDELLVNRMGSY